MSRRASRFRSTCALRAGTGRGCCRLRSRGCSPDVPTSTPMSSEVGEALAGRAREPRRSPGVIESRTLGRAKPHADVVRSEAGGRDPTAAERDQREPAVAEIDAAVGAAARRGRRRGPRAADPLPSLSIFAGATRTRLGSESRPPASLSGMRKPLSIWLAETATSSRRRDPVGGRARHRPAATSPGRRHRETRAVFLDGDDRGDRGDRHVAVAR